MLCNIVYAVRQMHALRRCRPLGDGQPGPPFGRRAKGTRRKATTAIWTDIVYFVFDAVGTERALIGADARIHGTGRQVDVAKFAVRSKFESHSSLLPTRPGKRYLATVSPSPSASSLPTCARVHALHVLRF